ncbi:MAG: primosomal protein N' [Bacillota bacterium]|nr:primosomal protein N' [Bacillota bacterium]
MKYIDIVIDNKSDKTDRLYTYGCDIADVHVGSRVRVPFAKGNKLRYGYVVTFTDRPEEKVVQRLKMVESLDEEVSLSEEMMKTAAWLKERYLCRFIDAIKLFVPAGSKAKRREKKNPLKDIDKESSEAVSLTGEQEKALVRINESIRRGKYDRFLIHGVTGSGKTEVYLNAAQTALRMGRTVIVLVPEISLTGQLVERFAGRFGMEEMAVLHSRLSPGERYDQWQAIRSGKVKVVVGARSAVFAPLTDIGLIIIDEEHESTYKSDFTPKYDTVEVALKRVQDSENKGVLILGSATPSVVTYSRAQEGIYKLLKLTQRYNKVSLPHVDIVDMREELKAGNRSVISGHLYDKMKENLSEGRQVILFLNRRGYSTFLSCRECGYVVKCPVCGLSLTYHKDEGRCTCHYCGYSQKIPSVCPECGSGYIRYFGYGTEKLQETVEELMPEYAVDRLDLDTIKAKGEMNRKLKAFGRGKTDILIGTQIIAKGLDFRNVGLAGIISADVSLNIPDFRSPERTFQLITQAAGRAGRGDKTGEVVIQTYSPDNYAVRFAAAQDYEAFYQEEMMIRRALAYPPFSDLYRIVFTSGNRQAAQEGAEKWYGMLTSLLPGEERDNVFRPQEAYMSKIKDVYRFSMLIKCPKGKRPVYSAIMRKIREEDKRTAKKEFNAVVDINPYSFS